MPRQLIGDAELLALASIVSTMAELDNLTQHRVTAYLVARYGVDEPGPVLHTRPAVDRIAAVVEQADNPWGVTDGH